MITGSPVLRSSKFPVGNGGGLVFTMTNPANSYFAANQDQLRQRAIEWACIGNPGYDNTQTGAGFPTTNCAGGFNVRYSNVFCNLTRELSDVHVT